MPRTPKAVIKPEEVGAGLADARAKGLRYYQPIKPCKRGHLTVRFTLNSCCRDCYKTNRNKSIMNSKKWQQRHEVARAKELAKQDGAATRPRATKCEVVGCGNSPVVFDHCHATGLFRGWICVRCNRLLGQIKDSPELLESLATYLRQAGTALRPADQMMVWYCDNPMQEAA